MNNVLNTAALKYAAQGFKVLPLHYVKPDGVCSCGGAVKNSHCKPAKHPYGKLVPRGLNDASSDPEVIRKWFADDNLNIGIVTGEPSKIFVVDQDDRDDGDRSMQSLIDRFGPLPMTVTQKTGNGKHYIFKLPEGVDIRNSQKQLGSGIDIRGTGGYIVAAPSKHANGRNYELFDNLELKHENIAEAPSWLIDMVKNKSKSSASKTELNNDLIHTNQFHIPERIEDGGGREAFLLEYAGHLRHRGIDQDAIEITLLEYNRKRIVPPLDEKAVLDRARRYANKSGSNDYEKCSDRHGDKKIVTLNALNLSNPLSIVSITSIAEYHGDVLNAKAFALYFRNQVCYVAGREKWLVRNPTKNKWQWADRGEVMQAAILISEKQIDQAKELLRTDQNAGTNLMKHAIASQKIQRLEAMIKITSSEEGMNTEIKELDKDPYLLGVENGVVNLKTGLLEIDDPSMFVTKNCSANYSPTASCPLWLGFLNSLFPRDPETIDTLQRLLGYTLTGSNTEEVITICYGHGSNGKSVFNNVITEILGDYVRVAPSSLLVTRRDGDSSPRNDLASLAGARYVTINETQSNDQLNPQIIKSIAGREKISARFLHKEYFEFTPTFKAWLRTNHKPIITDDDDGIWRRLVIIPFKQQFTEDQRDPYLEQKLLAERDGILNWMVQGALKWQKDGLELSQTIRAESQSYRKESDLLGEFLSDWYCDDSEARTEQGLLFNDWRTWCDQNGCKPFSKASFTRRLAERGYTATKSANKRYYSGLTKKV